MQQSEYDGWSLAELEASMELLVKVRKELVNWNRVEIEFHMQEIGRINYTFDENARPLGREISKRRGDNHRVKRPVVAHGFEGLTAGEREHFERLRGGDA
jgi:hypothetical protein